MYMVEKIQMAVELCWRFEAIDAIRQIRFTGSKACMRQVVKVWPLREPERYRAALASVLTKSKLLKH